MVAHPACIADTRSEIHARQPVPAQQDHLHT